MPQPQQQAGPSRPRPPITKLKPPPPTPPAPPPHPAATLPTKILQGANTRRNNARPNYPRNTIFVTRKTGLGSLLGQARGIILDEGFRNLTIYALSAAIPQALLMLHALIDILPFPVGPNGMWYEIRTGSVECMDEVGGEGGEDEEFPGLGEIEETMPVLKTRIQSSLVIELHVEPKTGPSVVVEGGRGEKRKEMQKTQKDGKKARPCAKKRKARAAKAAKADVGGDDEEDMMNA